MPPRRRPVRRSAYVGAALSVLALATVGWGVYRWATAGSSSEGRADDSSLGTQRALPQLPRKGSNRPSLSLSLPPDFVFSKAQIEALTDLVKAIAPYYVVTIILPLPQRTVSSKGKESAAAASDLALSSDPLKKALADVPFFDTRRVLEYSTTSGRQALAKALECDVYVEASMSPALARQTEPAEADDSSSDSSDSSDDDASWQANPDDTPDESSILIVKQGTKMRKQQAYLSSLTQGGRTVVLLFLPQVGVSALQAQVEHLTPDSSAREHKRAVKKLARAHAKEVGTLRRTFFPVAKTVSLDGKLILLDCAPEYLRAAARRVENIDTRSATGSDNTSTTSETWDEDYDPAAVQQAQLQDQQAGWQEVQNGLLHLRARWK